MIELHQAGSDCDAKFRTNQRAVFYLQKDEHDDLYVPSCTRSMGNAAPLGDDLLFLHGLPKSAVGTRLSGEVNLYEDSPKEAFHRVGGIPNVPVKISGPNNSTFNTKTNADGAYEVYKLPPGKYTVSIEVPKDLRTTFSTTEGAPISNSQTAVEPPSQNAATIKLVEHGGVSVGFVLKADTRLSGHMLDSNGNPKQGICLDLEAPEGRSEDGASFFNCSQEDGSFHMDMMAPGQYRIVAHDDIKIGGFKSTSTLYYPGVRDRNRAKIVTIEQGKYLENLDIKLPSNEKRYQITGRMQFADGISAPWGSVTFTSPQHGYTESTSVAPDGSFAVSVVPGMEGQLQGAFGAFTFQLASCPELKLGPKWVGMFRSIDATPISIASDSDQTDITLVLPSPSCKALLPPSRN